MPHPALNETPLPELDFDEIAGRDSLVVDVRSPSEFADDHVPGARSVPLFSDQERAVVGTLYRQVGPGRAREWGERRVTDRLATFVRELESALELDDPAAANDARPRVIACARGGVRSAAVTRLLLQRGHAVRRLEGGYRAYRSRVRARLETIRLPRVIAIHGLTGVGKTRVLRAIEILRPGSTLDLEGLAGHRSSVLGDVGLQPVSQKRFESRLVRRLEAIGVDGEAAAQPPWIVTEWEGSKIGNREIPPRIREQLFEAEHVELLATVEQRIELLADEYLSAASPEELAVRLEGLVHFAALGESGVRELQEWLRAGRTTEVVRVLLEAHYDPRYLHSQKRFDLSKSFSLGDVERTAEEFASWIEASFGRHQARIEPRARHEAKRR